MAYECTRRQEAEAGHVKRHQWMNMAKHAKREKILSGEKYTNQKVKAE